MDAPDRCRPQDSPGHADVAVMHRFGAASRPFGSARMPCNPARTLQRSTAQFHLETPMSFLSHWRIGRRLSVAFAVVVALTIVSAVFSQIRLMEIQSQAHELTAEQAERT